MKAKWFLISAFALFTGLSMVSCSSDDDPAPVFPEKEDPIKINANETKELSFTANMDWTIPVDKNWVGIVEADMAQSYKGAAGNIKFTVNVKDLSLITI